MSQIAKTNHESRDTLSTERFHSADLAARWLYSKTDSNVACKRPYSRISVNHMALSSIFCSTFTMLTVIIHRNDRLVNWAHIRAKYSHKAHIEYMALLFFWQLVSDERQPECDCEMINLFELLQNSLHRFQCMKRDGESSNIGLICHSWNDRRMIFSFVCIVRNMCLTMALMRLWIRWNNDRVRSVYLLSRLLMSSEKK